LAAEAWAETMWSVEGKVVAGVEGRGLAVGFLAIPASLLNSTTAALNQSSRSIHAVLDDAYASGFLSFGTLA